MILSEAFGVLFGIIGAVILGSKKSTNQDWRLLGFISFLVSNFGFFIYGYQIQSYGLIGVQVIYTITSIRGIINNTGIKD